MGQGYENPERSRCRLTFEGTGRVLDTKRDHAGNAAEPFIDDDAGGWPLRCCLRDSLPGDDLAIVAWSPFPWRGPYAETGPVVLHAQLCDRAEGFERVPAQFRGRRQILRPVPQRPTDRL